MVLTSCQSQEQDPAGQPQQQQPSTGLTPLLNQLSVTIPTAVPDYYSSYTSEEARYVANTEGLLAQYEHQINTILMTFNRAPSSAASPENLAKVVQGSILQVLTTSGTPHHISGIKAFVGTAAVRTQMIAFYHSAQRHALQSHVTSLANLVEATLDALEARIIALRMTVNSLFGPCQSAVPSPPSTDEKHALYLLRSTQQGTALLASPVTSQAILATEAYLTSTADTPADLPAWAQMEALSLENQHSFAADQSTEAKQAATAWFSATYVTPWLDPSSDSAESSSSSSSSSDSSTMRRSSVSSCSSYGSVEIVVGTHVGSAWCAGQARVTGQQDAVRTRSQGQSSTLLIPADKETDHRDCVDWK